jgi:surface protein
LIKHQRTVKSCLSIQEKAGGILKKIEYSCKLCNKEFTSNNGLAYHVKICKDKGTKQLEETVLLLKKEVEELKKRDSTHSNTTNTTNTTNATVETSITDDNIHNLVNLYVTNKHNQLPIDLQNKPIGKWNVSRVTIMDKLFYGYEEFDEDLDDWKVGNVTTMYQMFYRCVKFDKPLDSWNVSNVRNMEGMFSYCRKFDQPLTHWEVSTVDNMIDMFYGCEMFNQSLDSWDVSNVQDMEGMFSHCINFNQPLTHWDVSSVTNMNEMFNGCSRFNQPIHNWDVRNVESWEDIFEDCNIEEQNKPHFENHARVDVDARQIHTTAAKINYTLLISTLKRILHNMPIPNNLNYSDYISTTILELIHTSDESEEMKNTQRQGLQRIMNERLTNLHYQSLSPVIRESIFYALEYVKNQSVELCKISIE